jgi:hypothetical protein
MSGKSVYTALGLLTAAFLALGTFAGSASASTAVPGPSAVKLIAQSRTSLVPLQSQHPARPLIEEEGCTGSNETWFHVYGYSGDYCYGYTGYEYPDIELADLCSGNNYGEFEVYSSENGEYSLYVFSQGLFWPGYDFAPGVYFVYIQINGWSGSDSC